MASESDPAGDGPSQSEVPPGPSDLARQHAIAVAKKAKRVNLERRARRIPYRSLALIFGSLLLVAALSLINLSPNLGYLDATVAAGAESGNYANIVDSLAARAKAQEGTLRKLSTQGSVENLEHLKSASDSCDVEFAMVQDGVPAPTELELIARLPKSESVVIIGPSAASLHNFADIRSFRVGIGPKGSGTDFLARAILLSEDFSPLGLELENHKLSTQLDKLANESLDLGIFVLDEDALLIRDAIKKGLELASFSHLDVVARRFPFLHTGRIGAGQYDPIAVVPAQDHRVLRVDTLIVGNGCASRSETMALLSLLQQEFPSLVQHNLDSGGSPSFETSDDARAFFKNDGPEWADTHVPWLVDIMPLSNWFYGVMAISLLFNGMTSVHKFRLWRIDAKRERAQQVFRDILGSTLTPDEIARLSPQPAHLDPGLLKKLDDTLAALDHLRDRCRRYENSPFVPMGQELAYRYQEEQMEVVLSAVRQFCARAEKLRNERNATV